MIGETITVHRRVVDEGLQPGDDLNPGEDVLPDAVDYDDQGNPLPEPFLVFEIDGVAPAPGTRDEQAEEYGPRSVNAFTLYRRGDLDLRADDLVTIRGMSGWQVVADAASVDWVSPYSTGFVGSVAEVRRAS